MFTGIGAAVGSTSPNGKSLAQCLGLYPVTLTLLPIRYLIRAVAQPFSNAQQVTGMMFGFLSGYLLNCLLEHFGHMAIEATLYLCDGQLPMITGGHRSRRDKAHMVVEV